MGDYYWVNGVWAPAPRIGYLWTPGYWGFNNGGYVFNEGYWGPTVGFYGGINYGYGYGGYGYGGGRWEGRSFRYNTVVTRVNTTVIHNTYVDRNAVRTTTTSRTSFNGRGGINARPDAVQLAASRASHIRATAVQTKALAQARTTHISTARRTANNPTRTANVKRNGNTPSPTRNVGNTVRPTRQITRDTAVRRSAARTSNTFTRNPGRNGFNNRNVTRGPQVSRGPRVTRGPQPTRQPNAAVQKGCPEGRRTLKGIDLLRPDCACAPCQTNGEGRSCLF